VILLEESEVEALVPDFAKGGMRTARLVHRIDPLFGTGTRVIESEKMTGESGNLDQITRRDGFCPFCEDSVATATSPFPEEISASGRIIQGNSWAVPNIVGYAAVATVGIYDITRHFLSLEEFDRDTVANTLSVLVRHAQAVRGTREDLPYSSINANYLFPSGSSLVHPHMQSTIDPFPLGSQSMLIAKSEAHFESYGRSYLEELTELEEMSVARFIARTGTFAWFTPFAPSGFYEVWATAASLGEIEDFSDQDIAELATGLSLVLGAYRANGLSSFNFSLLSGGPLWQETGSRVLLRIVARSPLTAYYRSDVTYFERLCQEAMIDHFPEAWAEKVRHFFGPEAHSVGSPS